MGQDSEKIEWIPVWYKFPDKCAECIAIDICSRGNRYQESECMKFHQNLIGRIIDETD